MDKKKLIIALHIISWLLISLLIIIITGSYYSIETAILRTVMNLSCLAVLFYANSLFFVNQFLEKKRYVEYIIYTAAFFLLILFLRIKCNALFPDNFYEPFINNIYEPMIGDNLRTYAFAVISTLAVLFFSMIYQVILNREAKDRKNSETINQYQEAQIQFLKAQINPHFLFNTLNNIYSLAIAKSDETPEMILKLSELLRYVIYKGEEQEVLLENEVVHIFKFIELFQMRSEEDLDIRFNVEGATAQIRTEPMILIPLVENCFKHCDFDSNEEAFIEMNLTIDENLIKFSTLNSKDDKNIQKDKTGGVGLANIKKRLEISYKNHYQLSMKNNERSFEVYLEMQLLSKA
jgi:two-component system, LytTR family, sensor kinase